MYPNEVYRVLLAQLSPTIKENTQYTVHFMLVNSQQEMKHIPALLSSPKKQKLVEWTKSNGKKYPSEKQL